MLFNSIEFLIFLPITFILYWVCEDKIRIQNMLLLAFSYIFYGWWDARFLMLIVFSSAVDFTLGIQISKTDIQWKRKLFLGLSLACNLGLLGFFKYYNFFLESFMQAFDSIGISLNASTLKIILPVGISFYTFQTLSYTIDIYMKRFVPTRNAIAFFAFVSFFPQLVAGPIERASTLLPQFFKKRSFDYTLAADGMRQMLWGFFKKMVVADNCAQVVDEIFKHPDIYNGPTLWLGIILFSFQIYCDFSGYSDIAIGTAKLFGFKLMTNFRVPYFARDIGEFWRRWHISLTTWFRDYVYIPLGGSRGTMQKTILNVFIVFVVSGFWHGANWTFIFWGFLNVVIFVPLILFNLNRKHLDTAAQDHTFPSLREISLILINFFLVMLTWVFFRSPDIGFAFSYINAMFSDSLLQMPTLLQRMDISVYMITIMIIVEWWMRKRKHQLDIAHLQWYYRHAIYLGVVGLIFIFAKYNAQAFIYFQF